MSGIDLGLLAQLAVVVLLGLFAVWATQNFGWGEKR